MAARMTTCETRAMHANPSGLARALAHRRRSARARETGDLRLAALEKGLELSDHSEAQRLEEASIAGFELYTLYRELRSIETLPGPLGSTLLWALGTGVECALSIPEVALAALDPLIQLVGEGLLELGSEPCGCWRLEAERASITGEVEVLRERLQWLLGALREDTQRAQGTASAACTRSAAARLLGPHAAVDELERLVIPPGERQVQCDPCEAAARAHLAIALLREGRVDEARAHVVRALAPRTPGTAPPPLAPLVAWVQLEQATAGAELQPAIRELLAGLADAPSAYAQYAALLTVCRALPALAPPLAAALDPGALHRRAMHLARRLDARLARPHHVAECAVLAPLGALAR